MSSEAKAQGDLAKTPFAHLVIYLYQHRSSGTLLLDVDAQAAAAAGETEPTAMPETAIRILFRRGRAVAARTLRRHDSLEEALLPLCGLRSAPYQFHEGDLVGSGDEVTVGMFDPHAFVARAAARYPRPDIVDAVLTRFDGLRLRAQMGIDIERLRLNRKEAALIEVVRAEPNDVESLCGLSELSREDARRLLYVLIVTKLLTPYEERNPDSFASHVRERGTWGGVSGSSTPPRSGDSVVARNPVLPPRSGDSVVARNPVLPPRSGDSVVARNPVLPPRSGDSVVARNPLLPPASSSQPVSPPSSKSTGPQPAAWQGIASRAAQAAGLKPPPASSRSTLNLGAVRPTSMTPPRPSMAPVETLDAAGKVKRIEQLFQRSAYDEALPVIRMLISEDAKNAAYHAALGFALLSRSAEGVSKEIVDAVNAALRIDDGEPRALLTKALSYKRMGKDREAVHYFKKILSIDPGHIEAARELRLMNLRASEDKTPKR